MKSVEIKGYSREGLGKKESKKLRNEGKVPCVLYGTEDPVHFYAGEGDFRKVIYSPNVYLIDLEIEGVVRKAIVQDIQFHPVKEQVLHVDFLSISDDKSVKIEVPIEVEGYAAGMRSGGKLKVNLRRLKVKALAKDLPDSIKIDITELELGDSFKVSQLELDNIEFLNSKSLPVVAIVVTRAARAAQGTEEEGTETAAAEETTEA